MTSYTALQKLLGDTDNDLNTDAIASLAQGRSDWRKCVVAPQPNDDDDDDDE